MTEELKPCPFCGESRAFSGTTLDDGCDVVCGNDDCSGLVGYFPAIPEAIAAWNQRAPVSEWQDIATAPKDGTWVIGLRPPGEWAPVFVGHLTDMFGRPGYLLNPYTGAGGVCTHWMPLPASPVQHIAEAGR